MSRMVELKDGGPGSPGTVLSRRPDPSNCHRLSSFAEITSHLLQLRAERTLAAGRRSPDFYARMTTKKGISSAKSEVD